MTVYGRILLAATGSALLLLGALGFQYIGGLAPCPMCLWQRWPHLAAILIGGLAITVLWRQRRWLAALGFAIMAFSAGLGAYHWGVEQGWWQGPTTCTAAGPGGLSADELLGRIMEAPIVRCDEVAWSFLGLSMPAWNMLLSLGLAALWLASAAWWRMPYDSSSASQ